MLNWAARYFPILRELKQRLAETDSLLEIGSGSVGIGKFYHAPFVSCDINFPARPNGPMLPVVATAIALPFAERSFDAVVVSDVLEHVPPAQRMDVVREALRVARKVAVFGFPAGSLAMKCDQRLAQAYDDCGRKKPVWLQEHLQYPYPTETLFEDVKQEWALKVRGNENLDLHYWVMRREMHPIWFRVFGAFLTLLPHTTEHILRLGDREPYYRKIVVVQRQADADLLTAEL